MRSSRSLSNESTMAKSRSSDVPTTHDFSILIRSWNCTGLHLLSACPVHTPECVELAAVKGWNHVKQSFNSKDSLKLLWEYERESMGYFLFGLAVWCDLTEMWTIDTGRGWLSFSSMWLYMYAFLYLPVNVYILSFYVIIYNYKYYIYYIHYYIILWYNIR